MASAHPVDDAQRVIVDCLLDEYPAHLHESELVAIVGDPADTRDALLELRAAGLLHTNGDFYWPTRAAARYRRLFADV